MVSIFNSDIIFSFLMVFTRIASSMIVLPGIGEIYVTSRARLFLAFSFSILAVSVVEGLPKLPESRATLFLVLGIEALVGMFFGMIARIILSAVHIAGTLMTTSSGLGMAIIFDPVHNMQGSVVGAFLSNLAIALFFILNLHHLLLQAVVDSYHAFPPGNIIVGDMTDFLTSLMQDSFIIAIKMASPQLIIGMLIMAASGVMARLMPTVQIFFLVTPLQVLLSFVILIMVISASMMWYMDFIHDKILPFVATKH